MSPEELERMVHSLVELVQLQGKRIDRLEIEIEMRDSAADAYLAQATANEARTLALGAIGLAAENAGAR